MNNFNAVIAPGSYDQDSDGIMLCSTALKERQNLAHGEVTQNPGIHKVENMNRRRERFFGHAR